MTAGRLEKRFGKLGPASCTGQAKLGRLQASLQILFSRSASNRRLRPHSYYNSTYPVLSGAFGAVLHSNCQRNSGHRLLLHFTPPSLSRLHPARQKEICQEQRYAQANCQKNWDDHPIVLYLDLFKVWKMVTDQESAGSQLPYNKKTHRQQT